MGKKAAYDRSEFIVLGYIILITESYYFLLKSMKKWFKTHFYIFRLQELSTCNEENPDYSDIELIQHINVDVVRLIKLLNGKLDVILLIFKYSN